MSNIADERILPEESEQATYDRALHRYRYEIVHRIARQAPPGATLLDCASGNGYAAKILADCVAYTGVDISAETVARAREYYGDYGTFVSYDGARLPFADDGFDVVSSVETIEHLEKEAHKRFVAELLRVLRPGGSLVLTTPNREYLYKRYLKKKGWTNPFHKYEYAFAEFQAFMREFPTVSAVNAWVIGGPVPLPVNRAGLKHLPERLTQSLANGWIALGKIMPTMANSIVWIGRKNQGA